MPARPVLADQVRLPALGGAVEVKDVAAVLQNVAEVHRHHIDASAVLKAQAADFISIDDGLNFLRVRDGPVLSSHGTHEYSSLYSSAKARSSRRPVSPDFSGWNWVP